jgi:broad specificity phosphatase PhoE
MNRLPQDAFAGKENTLLLLRHGHTRPDAVWRYTGQREVPLTHAGRAGAGPAVDAKPGALWRTVYSRFYR